MISPEKLVRYKDFVDPENLGVPYNPRAGLEKLLGAITPDPKGVVLASMRSDWYGKSGELNKAVFNWLTSLGLSSEIWPLSHRGAWKYCQYQNLQGEITDGSLVDLGSVVKKAEDSSQLLYSRSIAGTELALPLVSQAMAFVTKAQEYGAPPKFDSMWRILSQVSSHCQNRRPLLVFDTIKFLIENPGSHQQIDLRKEFGIGQRRMGDCLTSLSYSGVINYGSGYKTSEVTKNDLTEIFYDYICLPAESVAQTLSPLPQPTWDKKSVAIFLENYRAERSRPAREGPPLNRVVLTTLQEQGSAIKLSQIINLCRNKPALEIKENTIRTWLRRLLKEGQVTQPKRGYYQLA